MQKDNGVQQRHQASAAQVNDQRGKLVYSIAEFGMLMYC